MIYENIIYENIIYYLSLTFNPEVLWIVLPLFASTIIILAYFGKYREETPGWNSLVANTLVIIFVSMSLLRYIYNFDGNGIINFVLFQEETIFASLFLIFGIVILTLDFKHFFPEEIAEKISSPITINVLAYVCILFVYSGEPELTKLSLSPPSQTLLSIIFSLGIIFIFLVVIFHLIHSFFMRVFFSLKKAKEKEKVRDIVEQKKLINRKKIELKKEEKKITKVRLAELNKQKKEAIKLKKVVKAPLTKRKKVVTRN